MGLGSGVAVGSEGVGGGGEAVVEGVTVPESLDAPIGVGIAPMGFITPRK